jgi:predicted lipoprotein
MKKWLKYIVLIAVAGLLAYNSMYFKKLDAKKEVAETELKPAEFAQKFWATKFTAYLDSAVEINSFVKMLQENPAAVFEKYSKTQGIGNVSFFLVKGEGLITDVQEDNVIVLAKAGAAALTVKLNTGIYFGNAVRDVTGLISMGDFSNTMDFNSVSSELNKIVRIQVILPFKAKAVKGTTVQFVGCVEINKEQINTDNIQLLPVKLNFK